MSKIETIEDDLFDTLDMPFLSKKKKLKLLDRVREMIEDET